MTSAPSIEDVTIESVRDAYRLIEYYYEQEWTDGLPVVPPVPERIDEFLSYVERTPDEVVINAPHLDRACTVRLAAINAIMAGCLPEYLPVVLTVAEILDEGQPLMQSTSGQAQFIAINGPIRLQLGFNSTGGVFGPGFRANATVSRAIRLIIMNALGIRPHEFDQGTQGTPAKYGFCIAENEEDSPWEPLHVERGFALDTSTVTAQYARSALHVENRVSNRAEEVLRTIADSMSYGGAWKYGRGRASTVVMGPTHAQMLARQGWTKEAVREFLWHHYGRKRGDLRSWGQYAPDIIAPFDGAYSEGPDDEFIRFAPSPDSITIIVAGAPTAGLSTVVSHYYPASETREIKHG